MIKRWNDFYIISIKKKKNKYKKYNKIKKKCWTL